MPCVCLYPISNGKIETHREDQTGPSFPAQPRPRPSPTKDIFPALTVNDASFCARGILSLIRRDHSDWRSRDPSYSQFVVSSEIGPRRVPRSREERGAENNGGERKREKTDQSRGGLAIGKEKGAISLSFSLSLFNLSFAREIWRRRKKIKEKTSKRGIRSYASIPSAV